MIDFSNDDLAEQFETSLLLQEDDEDPDPAEPGPSEPPVSKVLTDFVRIFLLRQVMPVSRLCQLVGPECCQLLLRLQAVTAITGESATLVPVAEAAAAAGGDEGLCGEMLCFSNVKIWPLEEDLLIATDQQTWPMEGFEPVMYLSDDSLALVGGAPRIEAGSVLDLCCGSGVQGIVALRHYADSATFVDINPRALDFVRFNISLNGLGGKVAGLYHGNLYEALPPEVGPFDVILANPPFLPNPQGIASQAIALFGDGGELGEQVLAEAVQGAAGRLQRGGRLVAVTYAPNVEDMPGRLERWLAEGVVGSADCRAVVLSGAQKPTEEFQPVASRVEAKCYQEALRRLGVVSLSEALTLVLQAEGGPGDGGPRAEGVEPREALFEDHAFLRSLTQRVAEGSV